MPVRWWTHDHKEVCGMREKILELAKPNKELEASTSKSTAANDNQIQYLQVHRPPLDLSNFVIKPTHFSATMYLVLLKNDRLKSTVMNDMVKNFGADGASGGGDKGKGGKGTSSKDAESDSTKEGPTTSLYGAELSDSEDAKGLFDQ